MCLFLNIGIHGHVIMYTQISALNFLFFQDTVMAAAQLNMFSLHDLLHDKQSSVAYLQQIGILHQIRHCNRGHEMKLYLSDKEDRWRCQRAGCSQQIQLKSGTWIEGTHLTYRQVVLFIYSWAYEMTNMKFCHRELCILSSNTVVDWNNYLREICAYSLLQNPIIIGGVNDIVEIDESLFIKRKHNVGRLPVQQWVFGGVSRNTNECFLYAVPDRSANILIPIIQQCIRPGTCIMSDMWRSYDDIPKLPGYNFIHDTVNHSTNFVNPISGAHTQRVEGLWNLAKKRNKKQFGTASGMLDSYLCEFMWRRRNLNNNPFERICEDIVSYWPPE